MAVLVDIPECFGVGFSKIAERSHSIVLTQQALTEYPQIFRDAVHNSHGKIYVLEESIGSIVSWAKRLREIAAEADMVVLHTIQDDVFRLLHLPIRSNLHQLSL